MRSNKAKPPAQKLYLVLVNSRLVVDCYPASIASHDPETTKSIITNPSILQASIAMAPIPDLNSITRIIQHEKERWNVLIFRLCRIVPWVDSLCHQLGLTPSKSGYYEEYGGDLEALEETERVHVFLIAAYNTQRARKGFVGCCV